MGVHLDALYLLAHGRRPQKSFLVIDSFFRNNPIFVFLSPLPLILKKLPFLQNSYNLSKLSTSYELQ